VAPIDLRLVPYGPPALAALREAVARAKVDDLLAPTTVLVPSNHVGVTARRRLAAGPLGPRGRGLAGATFLTPHRLAELLGAATLAGQGRRPVSTPVLAAAVRAALATEAGLFAAVADHPATEAALVASYRELRDVPPAALSALAGAGPRAAEVVRIHRAARAALAERWYDEEDLLAAATDRLAGEPRAGAELGTVVVHLPQALTLHAAALLRAVAAVAPTTVVAGTTGVPAADAEVAAALARLGLPEVEIPTGPLPVSPERTRITTASDADDEVRAAVRAVVDAARAGTPLDRIAVLHPAPDPYARLLHEHLEAAGIPRNGASPAPLSARAAGRTLLGLFALADAGWPRSGVLAWLAGAPILHDGRPAPVTRWEQMSRDAGVVGGRDHWDRRLATWADEHEAEARALAAARGDAGRVAQLEQRAGRGRALRGFVLGLIDEVTRAGSQPRPWGEHARWARRLLDRLLGPAAQRGPWPEGERRAAERIEVALDRLGALDAVEGPVPLAVARRTLAVELDTDSGRVGRLGDGVLVGSLAMGLGLDLDLVVVVGGAEGLLPAAPGDDSLLPDGERRAAGGTLPLRRSGLGRQHRHLLAALAGARAQVLSVPRGDLRRSGERVPSRWVLDVASALAGQRWWADDLAAADAPWVHHVASFDAGLRAAASPATEQEHRLRALLTAGAGPRSLNAVRALGDPVLSAGADLVAGRASDRLTRYDGRLADLPVASPADPEGAKVASATGLERWARCPFDHFLRDVLRVRELDNPEDALAITPADRGSVVHEVLELFVREVLARPPAERPGPADRWSAADRARVRELAGQVFAAYEAMGRTGRTLFWNRDRERILADLDGTLTFDEDVRRVHGGRHLAAELGFGFADDGVEAVALPLPDGRHVRFRGKADRIDLTGDGGLLVADYKTGRAQAYAGLSEADPDQGGRRLQLAVYGAAARAATGHPDGPVRAEYWFVSSRGRWARHGYTLTPEVEERISDTLGLIVEGIEGGLFVSHPTDNDSSPFNDCWSCDPDFLGVGDLRRAWAAKAGDPALAPYLALIDPERRTASDTSGDGDGDDQGSDGG